MRGLELVIRVNDQSWKGIQVFVALLQEYNPCIYASIIHSSSLTYIDVYCNQFISWWYLYWSHYYYIRTKTRFFSTYFFYLSLRLLRNRLSSYIVDTVVFYTIRATKIRSLIFDNYDFWAALVHLLTCAIACCAG